MNKMIKQPLDLPFLQDLLTMLHHGIWLLETRCLGQTRTAGCPPRTTQEERELDFEQKVFLSSCVTGTTNHRIDLPSTLRYPPRPCSPKHLNKALLKPDLEKTGEELGEGGWILGTKAEPCKAEQTMRSA